MEIIRLLLNSVKSEMCFLCFKESANTQNIHAKLEIESRLFCETKSLKEVINYLFPSFELTLTKACNNCFDLIIQMYTTMHTNNIMKKIINIIIDIFNKEISKNHLSTLDIYGSCPININLSSVLEVKKHPDLNPSNDTCNSIINNDDSFDDNVSNKLVEETINQEKQCPNCYKMFDNVQQYKTHMKNHGRKRRKMHHNCSHCNYKSLCKQSLQGHINKYHLKIRPFICKVCYKNFYHKKNLVEHETSHAQVRNEICEVCGEGFIHKKNLLEHLKLHSGEKPYNCEVCNKRFITSGRRLEHIKRCHGEKNECCLLCDKKFSLLKELARHMKTVHH